MRIERHRFLAGSVVAAGAALLSAPARAAQFEYKMGWDFPIEHPMSQAALQFAAAVGRESGGRINIQSYPNGALGSDPGMISQVRLGALQITMQSISQFESIVPIAGIERLGFAYPNVKIARDALEGDVGAQIRKELAAKGLLMFESIWAVGFREMSTRATQIKAPEDLQGLKMRVPVGAITTDLFRTLGASPVSVSGAEQYTALQTHVVDGAEGPIVNFLTVKLYEVQKYLSLTNHQFTGDCIAMNPDAFKALPSDLQDVVRRNANLWGNKASTNADTANKTVGTDLRRLGMMISSPDMRSFRAKLGPYFAKWSAEFGPTTWGMLEKYTGKLGAT